MLSYSERKAFSTQGNRTIEAIVTAAVETVAAEQTAEFAARKAVAAIRNQPIPFTEEQYKAATLVRTKLGWHKVAKVNAKSVSVETGYSWTDRIQREKIIEVR